MCNWGLPTVASNCAGPGGDWSIQGHLAYSTAADWWLLEQKALQPVVHWHLSAARDGTALLPGGPLPGPWHGVRPSESLQGCDICWLRCAIKGLIYQWIQQDMEKFLLREEEICHLEQPGGPWESGGPPHRQSLQLHGRGDVTHGRSQMVSTLQGCHCPGGQAQIFHWQVEAFQKFNGKFSHQWKKVKIYWEGRLLDSLHLIDGKPLCVLLQSHLYSELADVRNSWCWATILSGLEQESHVIAEPIFADSAAVLTGLLAHRQTSQDKGLWWV